MRRAAARSRPPRAVTVAGSDGSGGAGVQADLQTFAALGVWGCSAVTAITVQDTRGVRAVAALPAKLVADQLAAVIADAEPLAAKTGMLANRGIAEAVARVFREARVERLVVDPVLRATSGRALLDPAGARVLAERLLPLARVVTPNLAEASALSGIEVTDVCAAEEACRRILRLGPRAVVIKGGHLRGPPVDLLATPRGIRRFVGRRIGEGAHGTGCVFSAALAAGLARGDALATAVAGAKRFVEARLRGALAVGAGRPVLDLLRPETSRRIGR
jgi:hydroxymethylpyrimidine kinase/phosphomethylpyrimidine kinase